MYSKVLRGSHYFPPSPVRSAGEGGAKRRMRAGARKRDGGASGKTAPLRYAALIRPSGTFSQQSWEKGNVGERGNSVEVAP